MSKLSILVPCYNAEKFLHQALNSIKGQTFTDYEVLLINDGSTDGTERILREYTDSDSRFKLINKNNTGYGDSMNVGIESANGEYIGILEPDDYIESEMYERLVSKADETNAEVVRCFWIEEMVQTGESISRGKFDKEDEVLNPIEEQSIFLLSPAVWTGIYRRSWLNKKNIRFLPTPGASFQDTSFAFKTKMLSERYVVLGDHFYHYRIHGGNSIFSGNKKMSVIVEWDECVKAIIEHNMIKEFSPIIYALQYYTYKWNASRLSKEDLQSFVFEWSKRWREMSKVFPLSAISQFKIFRKALMIIYTPKIYINYMLYKRR